MTNTINVANERLSEFDRVFNLFDANADGSLTRQEITEALEVLGKGISLSDRAKLLSRIDLAGVVRRDSFIEWMASREDLDIAADLRHIFTLIDTDNSGKLSIEEFI